MPFSAELVGQRRTRTFHTPTERHGAVVNKLLLLLLIVNNLPYWQIKTLPHHCHVPANAIASKELSDSWSSPSATPINISGDLMSEEFVAAPQTTSPGKDPEPDSTCWRCLKVLVTWLPLFLLAPQQNTQSLFGEKLL